MAALVSIVSSTGGRDPLAGDAPTAEVELVAARDLALRAATGDPAATRQLLMLVAPAVLRSVRLVLGARSPDLEDVTQQALMAFVSALPTFRGECHPAGFASRIAVHAALSNRRRIARLRVVPYGAKELATATDLGRPPHDDSGTAGYQRRCVRDLLAHLPQDQAEVLALHVVVGHSLAEISQATSVPLNTVKSRLRLAKQALRRHLESECSSS